MPKVFAFPPLFTRLKRQCLLCLVYFSRPSRRLVRPHVKFNLGDHFDLTTTPSPCSASSLLSPPIKCSNNDICKSSTLSSHIYSTKMRFYRSKQVLSNQYHSPTSPHPPFIPPLWYPTACSHLSGEYYPPYVLVSYLIT